MAERRAITEGVFYEDDDIQIDLNDLNDEEIGAFGNYQGDDDEEGSD